jgi:hypothetical protein
MPAHLDQLERKVRHAALSRRYAEAVRLAAEFAEAAHVYALGLPKGDARAVEAGRRVADLYSWSLVVLQGARAACAAELRQVNTANSYSCRSGEARSAVIRLDA